jgi:4-hydroxy-3-polyprenylbenzoate decarboxylase
VTEDLLKQKFDEIRAVNVSLLKKYSRPDHFNRKKQKGHVRQLHDQICAVNEMQPVKMILYVEHTVDPNDLPTALWRCCNNLDPKRDHYLCKRSATNNYRLTTTDSYTACIGFDGTRKTKEFDDFHRDWPNIIVADEKTIKAVDEKWSQLGIGQFISSPSLKFRDQMYGEEAVVNN